MIISEKEIDQLILEEINEIFGQRWPTRRRAGRGPLRSRRTADPLPLRLDPNRKRFLKKRALKVYKKIRELDPTGAVFSDDELGIERNEEGEIKSLSDETSLTAFLKQAENIGKDKIDRAAQAQDSEPEAEEAAEAPTPSAEEPLQLTPDMRTTMGAETEPGSWSEDFIKKQFAKKVPLKLIQNFAKEADLNGATAREVVKVVRAAGYTLSESQIKKLRLLAGIK